MECYVDSDFACGWAVMPLTGYFITYVGYPLLWCSKLQTENTFSTIEAGYILLIQAMRNVILFMALMKEVSSIFDIYLPRTEVFCKLFKYNQSCIAVAESNFFSPGTKQITIKHYYFQSLVKNKIIPICYIDTR